MTRTGNVKEIQIGGAVELKTVLGISFFLSEAIHELMPDIRYLNILLSGKIPMAQLPRGGRFTTLMG